MQRLVSILFSLFLFLPAHTQVLFKTVVQSNTVEIGKPFAIGYILEVGDDKDNFQRPYFPGLSLVSGPTIHNGKTPDGLKSVRDYVFTLIATEPGTYIIHGARATINSQYVKSDDVVIRAVAPGDDEDDSEYFLRPGEDPYEKIRKNLFMKVTVDRRSCFVGEPVVATFKLYSRLQSKSDIVKNPGFYGFSVQDMVSLDDRLMEQEVINGKAFDVHTVRRVQLYPLQAGTFFIDPMEVVNKVEFSKSSISKKTDQEITEGYFENKDDTKREENTITYENNISTEKIEITVKPLPEKNKPNSFSGATGRYSISAAIEKQENVMNEVSGLVITIEGKGNFMQVLPPVIHWPVGLEGFDPAIIDSLDKMISPLKGKRAFRYPYVASKSGSYLIPAVSLTFFDPDSNRYKTVSTESLKIKIAERKRENVNAFEKISDNYSGNKLLSWLIIGGVLLICLSAFWWFRNSRNNYGLPADTAKETVPAIDLALEPAFEALNNNDSRFYYILQRNVWSYLGTILDLSGSKMNKQELYNALLNRKVSPEKVKEIFEILEACEASAFTKVEFADKKEILIKAKDILVDI